MLPGPVSEVPGPAGLCLSWGSSAQHRLLCPDTAQPSLARAGHDPRRVLEISVCLVLVPPTQLGLDCGIAGVRAMGRLCPHRCCAGAIRRKQNYSFLRGWSKHHDE